MVGVSQELLDILECPVAHVPLVPFEDWLYSTDPITRRKYPVWDWIPIMLVEESEVAGSEEFERVMAGAREPHQSQ